MPAQWTGDVIGKMHIAGISAKQLAAEVGWHEKYLSAVMNGHRTPKGAEEKLKAALSRLTNDGCESRERSTYEQL